MRRSKRILRNTRPWRSACRPWRIGHNHVGAIGDGQLGSRNPLLASVGGKGSVFVRTLPFCLPGRLRGKAENLRDDPLSARLGPGYLF